MSRGDIQYIPRNMHTVFALLCFVVVIHWLIFPYPSGLLHWHCSNLTIAPVPAKQPWWIWINTSCEFIKNDCITTTKQSTTKPCAYFLGYAVVQSYCWIISLFYKCHQECTHGVHVLQCTISRGLCHHSRVSTGLPNTSDVEEWPLGIQPNCSYWLFGLYAHLGKFLRNQWNASRMYQAIVRI